MKKAIKWVAVLILAHIACMLLFGLFFSGSVAKLSEDDPQKANLTVFVFNMVFDVLFSILYFKIETSYLSFRKTLKEALKKEDFSLMKFFKCEILKEHIMMLGTFAALQFPFVIFYSIWGVSLINPIIFEQFYFMDAGAYLLTKSSVLGLLLNTLLFGAFFSLIRVLFVLATKKDVEKEIIK